MDSILKILLLPFSIIYGLIISLRNSLFNSGIKPSQEYNFPVICFGNLSVGGTGKTPHTEFVIKLLKNQYSIATLSRGYGRKTKGFKIANSSDTAKTVGDEPYQIYSKFSSITVAVDEKRRRGIDTLLKLPNPPEVIVLDDAFQHRSVKAGLNILLSDYSKLYINDYILPSGRLREGRSGAKRADIIIITKSPSVLSPLEIRRITESIKPAEYQKVFFSYIHYQDLKPLNEAALAINSEENSLSSRGILLVSAIANPDPLLLHLKRFAKEIDQLTFKDHHFFSDADYTQINKKLDEIISSRKVIVITEKDSVKFDASKFDDIPVFSIPISIKFHSHQDLDFSEEIIKYVRSYTGSNQLYKESN